MATLDWPTLPGFAPSPNGMTFGVSTPKSRFVAFYTGDSTALSHAADRLTCTINLPACAPVDAGPREAWVMEVLSAGHFVRLGHWLRPEPRGSLRGTPIVQASAAAGARSVVLSGAAVGATLIGGDMLGVGAQLLPVAVAGAVAGAGGLITVPLVLPLRRPVGSGQAVIWARPTGEFELLPQSIDVAYTRARWQGPIALAFKERFAS